MRNLYNCNQQLLEIKVGMSQGSQGGKGEDEIESLNDAWTEKPCNLPCPLQSKFRGVNAFSRSSIPLTFVYGWVYLKLSSSFDLTALSKAAMRRSPSHQELISSV